MMNTQMNEDVARWYVIHTHPNQEERANGNLMSWNVETFAPRRRERKYGNGAFSYSIKPLFPRYIFARFKVEDLLYKVRFTRGVHSVVSFGDSPTPVGDDVIETLQSRCGADGFVEMENELELKSGDEVSVREGVLKGIVGVFERKMRDSERVMILLKTVSYQTHIVVDRGLVEKTAQHAAA